jgi:DNA mismatch endonuclease (patch repair protein)
VQEPTNFGRVDLILEPEHIAMFIDGCFWHGCPYHYVRPRTRGEFWSDKLRKTVKRDQMQTLGLEAEGWRVLRIWEHEIFENVAKAVYRIQALKDNVADTDNDEWRVVSVEQRGETDFEIRHLELLRRPEVKLVVEQRRSTKKWRRARRDIQDS